MTIGKPLVIDSFNHTFVDGVSGVGKSTLLEDVAIQIIRAGKPPGLPIVCVGRIPFEFDIARSRPLDTGYRLAN